MDIFTRMSCIKRTGSFHSQQGRGANPIKVVVSQGIENKSQLIRHPWGTGLAPSAGDPRGPGGASPTEALAPPCDLTGGLTLPARPAGWFLDRARPARKGGA